MVVVLSPLVFLITALLFFRWSFLRSSALALLCALGVSFFNKTLSVDDFLGISGKSLLLCFDIILIVFGALFFLSFLRHNGVLGILQKNLSKVSAEALIQVLLLAWLFGAFIEGVAGFGTPAVIVAPLLVSLGIPVHLAVICCLLANSAAVTFGAIGTPLVVGLSALNLQVSEIKHLAVLTATINFFSGWIVPLMIAYYVMRTSDYRSNILKSSQSVLILKNAFSFALYFLIPYLIFVQWGYEYPSLMGGALGIVMAIALNARKYLKSFLLSFWSYWVLIGLLILARTFLSHYTWNLQLSENLSHTLRLFNPGLIFLICIFLLNVKFRCSLSRIQSLASENLKKVLVSGLNIFMVTALTYTLMDLQFSSVVAEHLLDKNMLWFSASLGALGAFLAGSATVSNLLFAELQYSTAQMYHLSRDLALALQMIGAAAGNMIALPNVLVVQTAVGLQNQEGYFLRKLVFPCFLYLFIATIVGINFFNS